MPPPSSSSINPSSSVDVNPSALTLAATCSSCICTGASVRVTVVESDSSKLFVSGVAKVCSSLLPKSISLRACPAIAPPEDGT